MLGGLDLLTVCDRRQRYVGVDYCGHFGCLGRMAAESPLLASQSLSCMKFDRSDMTLPTGEPRPCNVPNDPGNLGSTAA